MKKIKHLELSKAKLPKLTIGLIFRSSVVEEVLRPLSKTATI